MRGTRSSDVLAASRDTEAWVFSNDNAVACIRSRMIVIDHLII